MAKRDYEAWARQAPNSFRHEIPPTAPNAPLSLAQQQALALTSAHSSVGHYLRALVARLIKLPPGLQPLDPTETWAYEIIAGMIRGPLGQVGVEKLLLLPPGLLGRQSHLFP